MNHEAEGPEVDGVQPEEVVDEAASHAQIEKRLSHVFHLAGDGEAAMQLMRMAIAYRWRQRQ
jgi:hypothetical protein